MRNNVSLSSVERELKKRLVYPYHWGQRQNNYYNGMTNFIYQIFDFDQLLNHIKSTHPNDNDLFNYALNRWFNFWSAEAIVDIICSHPNVRPEMDFKHRMIDFYIDGIQFDHKTSVFPKGYHGSLSSAQSNPGDLIEWFYQEQSQQQRKHMKNRLFVVLHSSSGEHWKLKAEISWMKGKIDNYIDNFSKNKLLKFTFDPDEITLSDIIWAIM